MIPSSINAYADGRPYSRAQGRYAPRCAVEDRLEMRMAVVNLSAEQPSPGRFLQAIIRELKIRFYQRKTIKNYRTALGGFLRWFGSPPHQITREHVRQYLELLVDGGASASWVGVHLPAIRTAFDKMCGRQVTLGLLSPRRASRLPVVLSEEEVMLPLDAAPSLRDKLLLGLMYATGLRVGEVVRVRWRDLDFDRQVLNVWEGKGRKDREVMLPESFKPLLVQLSKAFGPEDFVFPSDRPNRHLSPRTVARVMKRALAIAGIGKAATPHSLRHSFACHMITNGTDVRFIQQLLGHKKLETTTIYTRVAPIRDKQVQSPLDVLFGKRAQPAPVVPAPSKPVGRMQIDVRLRKDDPKAANVTVTILSDDRFIPLDGIVVREARPGWVSLELPPLEQWEKPLCWLTAEQRARVESPDFYRLLQEHISRRFLALKRS